MFLIAFLCGVPSPSPMLVVPFLGSRIVSIIYSKLVYANLKYAFVTCNQNVPN